MNVAILSGVHTTRSLTSTVLNITEQYSGTIRTSTFYLKTIPKYNSFNS